MTCRQSIERERERTNTSTTVQACIYQSKSACLRSCCWRLCKKDKLFKKGTRKVVAEKGKNKRQTSIMSYGSSELADELAAVQRNDPATTMVDWQGEEAALEHGVALARALASNTHVKFLALGDCSLGDAFAVALAQALKVNQTLQCVELALNFIQDEGAVALA